MPSPDNKHSILENMPSAERQRLQQQMKAVADQEAINKINQQRQDIYKEQQAKREEADAKATEQLDEKLRRLYSVGKKLATEPIGGYETFVSIMNRIVEGIVLMGETSVLKQVARYANRRLLRGAYDYVASPLWNSAKQSMFPPEGKVTPLALRYLVDMDDHGHIRLASFADNLKLSPNLAPHVDEATKRGLDDAFSYEIHRWVTGLENGRYEYRPVGPVDDGVYTVFDTALNRSLDKNEFMRLRDDEIHGFAHHLQTELKEQFTPEVGQTPTLP